METHVSQVYRSWGFGKVLRALCHDIDIAIIECGSARSGVEWLAAVKREVTMMIKTFCERIVCTFEMAVIEYGITCSGEVAQIQAADESAILGNHAISTCTDG